MRKDGKRLNVLLTISPIISASGKIVGGSRVARDISERKEAEATLAQCLRRTRCYTRQCPGAAFVGKPRAARGKSKRFS